VSEELTVTPSDNLTWEIEVPLLSNRAVVGGMARVLVITGAIICGLMAVLFGAQGEWELIAPVSAGLLGACVGLFVPSLLVMVLVFRNRIRFRFTVGDKGVRIETIDRTVRLVNRLAVGAGALGGSPQTAGAGLIGTGRETEGVRWEGSFRASYNDRARTVAPRNAWRTLIVVYCTSENYAQVAEVIRSRMEVHRTASRVPRHRRSRGIWVCRRRWSRCACPRFCWWRRSTCRCGSP